MIQRRAIFAEAIIAKNQLKAFGVVTDLGVIIKGGGTAAAARQNAQTGLCTNKELFRRVETDTC